MKPTPKLRYVEREVRTYICEGIARCEFHKFLQQWWEPTEWNAEGMWRDVPLEEEND